MNIYICDQCKKNHTEFVMLTNLKKSSGMKPRYLCSKECLLEYLKKSHFTEYDLKCKNNDDINWVLLELNKYKTSHPDDE